MTDTFAFGYDSEIASVETPDAFDDGVVFHSAGRFGGESAMCLHKSGGRNGGGIGANRFHYRIPFIGGLETPMLGAARSGAIPPRRVLAGAAS